ncbi:MAG: DUF4364 family protein [Clostridia bacterium]|nr:DUF4364 family protein [Clostridia bacterium]
MQVKGETSVNKLIMLFVFDKMESAISERILVDICSSSNEWLNYMDCVGLIPTLISDGFICEIATSEDPLYTITPEGRETLANFYINISRSLREDISKFIKKNSSRFRIKQDCKSDYYQNKDGTYTVFLKILAPVQPMLELKFVVPDKKTANVIYKKWEDKALELYSVVYETLAD